MLALATTHDGDVPLFLQPLDGNRSDKVSLLATVTAIQTQLREADGEASVYVADNGIYSEARELKGKPVWLSVHSELLAHPQYAGKGRPRKDASPTGHQRNYGCNS